MCYDVTVHGQPFGPWYMLAFGFYYWSSSLKTYHIFWASLFYYRLWHLYAPKWTTTHPYHIRFNTSFLWVKSMSISYPCFVISSSMLHLCIMNCQMHEFNLESLSWQMDKKNKPEFLKQVSLGSTGFMVWKW